MSTTLPSDFPARVKELARQAGFDLCGIAPVREFREIEAFPAWIAAERHGEMRYLEGRDENGELKRASLARVAPWARSVVVCAINYNTDQPYSIQPTDSSRGWISRYAWSREDYHDSVLKRLRQVEDRIKNDLLVSDAQNGEQEIGSRSSGAKQFAEKLDIRRAAPEGATDFAGLTVSLKRYPDTKLSLSANYKAPVSEARGGTAEAVPYPNPVPEVGPLPSHSFRSYVDTGPLIERVYAKYAGIGWMAKNTCIINQKLGSWLFLGVILTSLELQADLPAADRCGSCTRCIDACPTHAFIAPGELDARLCISYLTIEKRGEIPEAVRAGMGRHVFGCDICQDVCPWNRKAPVTEAAEFQAREGLVNPALDWLAEMQAEEFRSVFRGSPIRRTKLTGLRRNAVIAMGNSGDEKFVPTLERLAEDTDPVVSEHAKWSLKQLRD